jgi:hypothetical protein
MAGLVVKAGVGPAVCACLGMTVVFVASLYMLPASIRRRPRDDPKHIRARFLSVMLACTVSVAIVHAFTVQVGVDEACFEGGWREWKVARSSE